MKSTSPWWTLVAVSLGGALVALDGTALTIAGPVMGRQVGASFTQLQWLADGYLLALGAALFPAGRLADRVGRRRVFLAGVGGFAVVSLLIAVSASPALLIAERCAQGLCGALLQPAALALLRAAFAPRGTLELALGIWGGASAAAIAAGPILAGLVVQHLGWPAVFALNAPVAVLTAALTLTTVAESRAGADPPRQARLLRAPGVALGAALTGLCYFALFGLLFFLTLYLQNLRGLDPVAAGAWLLPVTTVVILSAPLGGALTGRFGPRWPAAGGLLLVAAGVLGFGRLGVHTGQSQLLPAAVLLGFGTGIALIATTQVIIANAPEDLSALAAALQQVATQLGGLLGILLLGSVLSWRVGQVLPPGALLAEASQGRGSGAPAFVAGFHLAVLAGAAVLLAGAVLALRIKDSGPPAQPSNVDGERRDQQRADHQGVQ